MMAPFGGYPHAAQAACAGTGWIRDRARHNMGAGAVGETAKIPRLVANDLAYMSILLYARVRSTACSQSLHFSSIRSLCPSLPPADQPSDRDHKQKNVEQRDELDIFGEVEPNPDQIDDDPVDP